MPWVKLDDHFAEHPKLAQVGIFGLALWVSGLAYCNRNLTDGYIPLGIARTLVDFSAYIFEGYPKGSQGDVGWTARLVIEDLVGAGLWEKVPGGYQIHDYAFYQPTKVEVLADREKVRDRVQRHRNARRNAATNGDVTALVTLPPVPVPVPSVSYETESSRARAKRDPEIQRMLDLQAKALHEREKQP